MHYGAKGNCVTKWLRVCSKLVGLVKKNIYIYIYIYFFFTNPTNLLHMRNHFVTQLPFAP